MQAVKILDRESQNGHELIIQATENCNATPASQNIFNASDDTLLKVIVQVTDINDNAPKFVSKVFTGGVTTEADFGTQFMHVKVIEQTKKYQYIISVGFCGSVAPT